MPTSSAGLLLLLVAFVGIAGFLTGNLDRWLAALFTPPAVTGTATSASRTGSIGSSTVRSVA